MPLPNCKPKTADEREYAAEFDRATALMIEIEDLLDALPQIGDPVREIDGDDVTGMRLINLKLEDAKRTLGGE